MGKVKVVEIENDVPAPEASSPEVAAAEEPTSQPESSQEETQIEVSKPVVEEKPPEPKKKQLEYVTCDVCNKSMLVKTYTVIKNYVNQNHRHHLQHLSPKLKRQQSQKQHQNNPQHLNQNLKK